MQRVCCKARGVNVSLALMVAPSCQEQPKERLLVTAGRLCPKEFLASNGVGHCVWVLENGWKALK